LITHEEKHDLVTFVSSQPQVHVNANNKFITNFKTAV